MEKLIIKIKMPSPSAMELHFKCSLCEKTFSNGKALGGHKRWHLVKGKTVVTTKSNLTTTRNEPKISSSSRDGLTSDDAKKLTCPICNKAFISDRSLHGHMKKHPERNWRGMIPPPITREKVENGDDLLVDDDKSGDGEGENDKWFVRDDLLTAGWPVTGKRGRLGKAPVNSPATTSVLDQSTGLSFDLNEFPPEYSF